MSDRIDQNRLSVPRTRGDEPLIAQKHRHEVSVFPAHAGMNRTAIVSDGVGPCVPRTRGDEPMAKNFVFEGDQCSPHTRG